MSKRDRQNTSAIKHGQVKTPLMRHLDSVGDGSGTTNANLDYSSTAGKILIAPAAGEVMRLTRMIGQLYDTSGMQAQEYGNLGAALTNGVSVQVVRDGVQTLDLTDNHAIKINAAWGGLCYDVDVKSWGSGNEMLLFRWTFSKMDTYIRLVGDENDALEVNFNDDLRGLIDHHYLVQGYYE